MTSSEYLTEDANDITAQPIREADVGNGPVTVMSSNFGAADLLMEPNPPVMRPIGSQTSPLDGFMQPKHDLDQPVVNPESAEGVELRRAALREAFMALTDEERTSILVAMPITASGSSPQKNVNANPSVPPIKVSLPARQYLLSEEDDEPVNESSGERIFAFQHHEALRDLVRLKKHLPLMLFLAKSIETLFLDFGSIPTITNKGVGGTAKHTVIDTSFFPDKAKMDIADWSEAWGNILVFYKENSSPGYFQRQLDHHNWMIGCQFLKENFATILRFDILIRKEHAASPVEFVLLIYKEKYLRVEHEVMAEELMALHAETAAFKTSQHYSSSLSTPPRSSQRSEHAASSARPSPQVGVSQDPPSALFVPVSAIASPSALKHHLSLGSPSGLPIPTPNSPPRVLKNLSASSGTSAARPDARVIPLFTLSMHAPSAATPPIMRPFVHASELSHLCDRIITPYSADAFEVALEAASLTSTYPRLVHKLRHGFPLGDMPPLIETFTPSNHTSTIEHHEVILLYLCSKQELGRMSGPFSHSEVEGFLHGPFCSSPLHVVPKATASGEPPKHRLTINLSFKDDQGISVNDLIDSDEFPTRWGGARDVEHIIACAPLGTQAATLNIESAFCTIPVLPEHKNFTVVECDGFWIDHVCPFGCLSSGGNQGEIADAIVDILEHKGIGPIKKWVDNFDVFRYPSTTGSFRDVNDTSPLGQSFRYDYDLSSLKDAVASLGIPWHKTKVQEFGNAFRYVGFDWLILEKSVSLPDEKRLRYLALVTTFTPSPEVSLALPHTKYRIPLSFRRPWPASLNMSDTAFYRLAMGSNPTAASGQANNMPPPSPPPCVAWTPPDTFRQRRPRAPLAGNTILPSPFRPHMLATE
ncbi:hypothetical protein CVT25_000800 [Psilocybe cyanescens]|uniref:Uncharacterized protein n=1 Tax=Psilocybe cyanescens TaxID=93625 RepID=A0A409XH03_PSICY|nr:hypothetical protein CVT25_000800 [Psilocybe cyanescens]